MLTPRRKKGGNVSQVTDVIMIVDPADDPNVEDISFWLAGDEPRSDDRTTARIGALMPLTGALGAELWGGDKDIGFSLWGAVTNNLDWELFFERVETTAWADRERVQLLLKEDGDSYFRLYMFKGKRFANFAPVEEGPPEPRPQTT
jgi:hypothetical protein